MSSVSLPVPLTFKTQNTLKDTILLGGKIEQGYFMTRSRLNTSKRLS